MAGAGFSMSLEGGRRRSEEMGNRPALVGHLTGRGCDKSPEAEEAACARDPGGSSKQVKWRSCSRSGNAFMRGMASWDQIQIAAAVTACARPAFANGKQKRSERPTGNKRVSRSAHGETVSAEVPPGVKTTSGPNFRKLAGREFEWLTGGRTGERAAKTREPSEARVFWCGGA